MRWLVSKMEENKITSLNEILESFRNVAYIKLVKNTKGFGWEIKQLSLDVEELEKLNNEMINRFGSIE